MCPKIVTSLCTSPSRVANQQARCYKQPSHNADHAAELLVTARLDSVQS